MIHPSKSIFRSNNHKMTGSDLGGRLSNKSSGSVVSARDAEQQEHAVRHLDEEVCIVLGLILSCISMDEVIHYDVVCHEDNSCRV